MVPSSIIVLSQIIEFLICTLFPIEEDPKITLFSIVTFFPVLADSDIQLL